MMTNLLTLSLWEAIGDVDRIDETPYGQVPKLLDGLSAKLIRAVFSADALVRAAEAFLPKNINLDTPDICDGDTIPLDVSMGELRALAAAFRAATGEA